MVNRSITWLLCPLLLWAQEPTELSKDVLSPLVVTAQGGFPEPLGKSVWSLTQLKTDDLLVLSRSMPEAMTGMPSVMVQKTALGQSSPYIRGLTGYHNVLLVDGIRLNHSAMRSGPNQYWSTVELYGTNHIEALRGSYGTLYGADAVGGVVNVLSGKPSFGYGGKYSTGEFFGRLSSAERSWTVGILGEVTSSDWFVEVSHTERSFGDLEGGSDIGRQPNTGYDMSRTQARLARKISNNAHWVFGFQRAFMDDVPRTHKTIDGLSWEGLSVGKELWRQLDQDRELYYGRFEWDDTGGWAGTGQITLSLHQHGQERNRRKSSNGDLIDDRQGFELDDLGFNARFESDEMHWGKFSYGLEFHLESLSSFGSDFNNTSMVNRSYTQGPLAADASYNRYASYLQYAYEHESGWKVQPGIRYSSVHADLKEFYIKNNDFNTQSAPHSKTYEEVIGSVRVRKNLNEQLSVFGGLSQGFRPPSLYDLTSTDETSIIEEPNLNLKSEDFIQFEVGARHNAGPLSLSASYYHTWIRDMIVRSPYLDAASGKTKSVKSNGDGYIHGLELELGYEWSEALSSKLSFSWMDGEVQQLLDDNLTGTVTIEGRNFLPVDRATTRLMPIQAHLTTRYQAVSSPWMGELSLLAVGKADDLSLKDETDNSRIPEYGTPAYLLLGMRGSYAWDDYSKLTLAVENLSDIDYRVHGSGVNGAGRNFILSLSRKF